MRHVRVGMDRQAFRCRQNTLHPIRIPGSAADDVEIEEVPTRSKGSRWGLARKLELRQLESISRYELHSMSDIDEVKCRERIVGSAVGSATTSTGGITTDDAKKLVVDVHNSNSSAPVGEKILPQRPFIVHHVVDLDRPHGDAHRRVAPSDGVDL